MRDSEHEYRAKVAMGKKKLATEKRPSTDLELKIARLEENIRGYTYRVNRWKEQLEQLKKQL